MRFTNGAGLARYGRYRVAPEAGVDLLSEADAAGQDADFLFDELSDRIAKGPIRSEYLEVLATRA